MTKKVESLVIEGITYVPESSVAQIADSINGMPFVLIRGYGSGVQYGYLKERNGCEVILVNSRRIWSWNKATDCNQITVNGIDAATSKVTVIVPEKRITDVIEDIIITKEAQDNLVNQPIWKK